MPEGNHSLTGLQGFLFKAPAQQRYTMTSSSYTVQFSDEVAGMALRVASTSPAELAAAVPSMSLYKSEDAYAVITEDVRHIQLDCS